MPKVSVIIPNYNHAQFLNQRLQSVVRQTFQDFEIIFLDDCSEDESLTILAQYTAEHNIQVHVNDSNSGSPFIQWNRGIELAKGEYIWIAESDDFAELDFLATLVKALDDNASAGLAYCQSWQVTTDSEKQKACIYKEPYRGFHDNSRWNSDYVNSGIDELGNYLVFNNTIPNASAVLIRRAALENKIRAPQNMRLAGDWMFWAKILIENDIEHISRPLNYFRQEHQGSQRSKTRRQGLDLIEGLEVYSFIKAHVPLASDVVKRVRHHQVRLWGILAFKRLFSWRTNQQIYQKITVAHFEDRRRLHPTVILTFAMYFFTTPLRMIPLVKQGYKRFYGMHEHGK